MDDTPAPNEVSAWRALAHRWLIQYNPLYLVSAALVLVGVILLSRGVAATGGPLAQLGITAVAEIYAWALVGSAALLVRIRLRRPALMLALLAAVYQCDLTLHTATSTYLGTLGMIGSALWLVSFVAKLHVLAWAMRLRLSRSARLLPAIAATGMATLPWIVRGLEGDIAVTVLAAWWFGLLAAGLWTTRAVTSRVALDEWASTVARRSLRGLWIGWAAMITLHTMFWATQHPEIVHVHLGLAVALLLATRFIRGEIATWVAVSCTLIGVGSQMPEHCWLVAAMAAVVLVLRAFRYPTDLSWADASAPPHDPYRTLHGLPPVVPARWVFVRVGRAEMTRLLTGALACAYLSAWSYAWSTGPWPGHVLGLDAILLAIALLAMWRLRVRLPFAVVALSMAHFVAVNRLVPVPQSIAQWGLTCVGVGFALLVLSLVASVHFRRVDPGG